MSLPWESAFPDQGDGLPRRVVTKCVSRGMPKHEHPLLHFLAPPLPIKAFGFARGPEKNWLAMTRRQGQSPCPSLSKKSFRQAGEDFETLKKFQNLMIKNERHPSWVSFVTIFLPVSLRSTTFSTVSGGEAPYTKIGWGGGKLKNDAMVL